MSDFLQNIEQYDNITLESIRDAARNALPYQYRRCPWIITNQGGSDPNNTIYTEELQLDAYLASYVDWHKGKLTRAFELLNEPLPRQFNIIDWACGQGIATLFLLDYIRKHNAVCSIREVVLIEPSSIALHRAEYLIHLANPNIEIRTVNKRLDDVVASDLKFNHQFSVFHMFSNILDIGGIDHKHLSQIIYTNSASLNTIVCVLSLIHI